MRVVLNFPNYNYYKLSLFDNKGLFVDSTTMQFNALLKRNEVMKHVRTYLNRIGYGGQQFKTSLKRITSAEFEAIRVGNE